MTFEAFIERKFSRAHERIIVQANKIIAEYTAAGYSLTLRQLYYQFVSRDIIDNHYKEYKRLGYIIDNARKAGLIDWDSIEDRTRFLRRVTVFDSPEKGIETLTRQYKLDPWEEQSVRRRIEIWIEKDALIGVIQPICDRFRVPYFSCRGYGSSSEIYEAGKRLSAYQRAGYECLVLHLGDHDPSGVQMSEDNQNRINTYARGEIEFRRIALTLDQIKQYNPPPNFAKQTDSRTKWYVDKFNTDEAWELDALTPQVIEQLIDSHIQPLIDQEEWQATMDREQRHLETLAEIISDWNRTKAAPDMLKMIRSFAEDYPVEALSDDEGAYDNEDSAFAGMVIDESQQLIRKHDL